MTGLITVSTIGENTGPFNIYSNIDGYISAFATSITRDELLSGYATTNIPEGTTFIKISSYGECNIYLEIINSSLLCYKVLPELTYYFTDYIFEDNVTYLYGNISNYQNGISTVSNNGILMLNENLTQNNSIIAGTGFNSTLYSGTSLIKQSDGKLIATGVFTSYNGVSANRIIRLNSNGSIDTSFNYGTGFNNFTQHPAIDNNNRIIIPGIFDIYNGISAIRIIRLMSDGTVDTSFVTGTSFNNTTTDVLVNSDNSMFVLGYFNSYKGTTGLNGIVKLLENGNIDTSFIGGTGFSPYLPNNPNYFMRVPGEDSFYVAGYFTSYKGISANRIIKLNTNGSVDTSFNSGTGFNNVIYTIKLIWGNKILINGEFTSYNGISSQNSIILNLDGSVFYSFNINYYMPFPIGNKLYGAILGECLELIYEYIE